MQAASSVLSAILFANSDNPTSLNLTVANLPWAERDPCGFLLESLAEGELMANLKGLESVVSQLRIQRTNLISDLRHVDAALSVLGKLNGGKTHAEPRRTLSASARRKIAAAQRARWARVRAQNVVPIALKRGKRTMSALARRKIAAAQRARWAKVKRAA
jgi:hypothetical protein